LQFFQELKIDTKAVNILDVTTSITPTRSNLITRVKYELLKNFFVAKGKPEADAQRMISLARRVSILREGVF
jgi:hypothetical protein